MDAATLLKMVGPAVLAAVGAMLAVLIGAVFLPKVGTGRRLREGAMAVALAAGFVAGYAVMFAFPQGAAERAWYLDQPWKMAVVAAMMAGVLLGAGRMLPAAGRVVANAFLVVTITFLIVRGPWLAPAELVWENWKYLGGFLALGLGVYLMALYPAGREERLWLLGPLVMWATISGAAVVVMAWVDQGLGKMLILLAVLAGGAGVMGIFKPWRGMAGGAGGFLAAEFAAIMALAGRYNDVLPVAVLVLLGCGPLGAAVGWLPGLRRRPWVCVVVGMAVTLGVVAGAVGVAVTHAPALE